MTKNIKNEKSGNVYDIGIVIVVIFLAISALMVYITIKNQLLVSDVFTSEYYITAAFIVVSLTVYSLSRVSDLHGKIAAICGLVMLQLNYVVIEGQTIYAFRIATYAYLTIIIAMFAFEIAKPWIDSYYKNRKNTEVA